MYSKLLIFTSKEVAFSTHVKYFDMFVFLFSTASKCLKTDKKNCVMEHFTKKSFLLMMYDAYIHLFLFAFNKRKMNSASDLHVGLFWMRILKAFTYLCSYYELVFEYWRYYLTTRIYLSYSCMHQIKSQKLLLIFAMKLVIELFSLMAASKYYIRLQYLCIAMLV